MSDLPFREKRSNRRAALLLSVVLVALLGSLYIVGFLFTSDKVPQGTTVADVPIGGLSPAAARAKLEKELGPRSTEPVIVTADGQRGRIDPAEAGLAVDWAESVERAGGGRSWNPARMWAYFTEGDDLDAVLSVDDDALAAAVDEVAKTVDTASVEGQVRFVNGRVVSRMPEAGREVDRDAAAAAVQDAYLGDGEPVELEVTEVVPEVTAAQVQAAMDDFANPAMSAPVTLVLGGKDVVLRPEDYSRALSMKAQNGTLVPVVDQKKLVRAIERAMEDVALSPEPATVQIVDGAPRVIPGKNGVTFDPEEVTAQFPSLVVQRGANRRIEVAAKVKRPDFTTADARRLGVNEVVSSFTTQYPHADYRNTNLGRAADLVSGTLLKPGETFSLNDTVGERTAENGFTEGFIISNGVFKEDFGGGVSQVATTLFNAAFFAGLEDVEHKPHSFYIDRYPVGREATVAWGAVDLKFKNDTPYGVLIQAWINPSSSSSAGEMNVRMWSTKYWEITTDTSGRYNQTSPETRYIQGDECVPNSGYGGFDIDVFRYFRRVGSSQLVRKETMHTRYTPSDHVVCGKKPPGA